MSWMHVLEPSSSVSSSREFGCSHLHLDSQALARRLVESRGARLPHAGQLHVGQPNAPACSAHTVSFIATRPAMPDFTFIQQRKINAARREWALEQEGDEEMPFVLPRRLELDLSAHAPPSNRRRLNGCGETSEGSAFNQHAGAPSLAMRSDLLSYSGNGDVGMCVSFSRVSKVKPVPHAPDAPLRGEIAIAHDCADIVGMEAKQGSKAEWGSMAYRLSFDRRETPLHYFIPSRPSLASKVTKILGSVSAGASGPCASAPLKTGKHYVVNFAEFLELFPGWCITVWDPADRTYDWAGWKVPAIVNPKSQHERAKNWSAVSGCKRISLFEWPAAE